jgi:hypothetical protein
MLKINRFLLIIVLFFFVVSCGGGPGGGGSSSGESGASDSIKLLETYTDFNGIAVFTLLNGETETIQVVDQQSGNAIAGVKVTLILNPA